MVIFRFINSKDIREHLRNIGYEFNSLEAAWLIYQCHDATIDEKHKAWNELIEKMPDCPIAERLNTEPQDSLHAFLRQYMELEDKYINEFYDEKHADTFDYNKPFVYKFKYIYRDGTEYEWDTVFSCFDALYEGKSHILPLPLIFCALTPDTLTVIKKGIYSGVFLTVFGLTFLPRFKRAILYGIRINRMVSAPVRL